MRHRVLLMGPPGSGKSETIVALAIAAPSHQVIAFDFQDGILPLIEARGEHPPNLKLIRIEEAEIEDAWIHLKEECQAARSDCRPGDWIAYDMADIPWEMAERFYVFRKYGMELADYLLEAVTDDSKGTKKVGFGGLTTDDWTLGIRPQYYMTIPRTLGAGCRANVLVTAPLKDVVSWQKDGQTVFQSPKLPMQYKIAGVQPGGERELTAQVDVVLHLEHPSLKKWQVRTLGKNRRGLEFGWTECTDSSALEVYAEKLGVSLDD